MKLWLLKYARKIIKIYIFIVSYRHPNLSLEETDFYFSSLNSILEKVDNEKPIGIVLTGDFNADTREGQIWSEMSIFNNLE